MVSNLQFAAVAGYLLWCLFASLSGTFNTDEQEAESNIDESAKKVPVG